MQTFFVPHLLVVVIWVSTPSGFTWPACLPTFFRVASLKLQYSWKTRSTSLLLILCLLASPGHQQLYYLYILIMLYKQVFDFHMDFSRIWWLYRSTPVEIQRSRLHRPISKIRMIWQMDAKTWMTSLIIMFAVRPICVQDSIFKTSSESPGNDINN